jgi:hypothetical protein
MKTGSLQAARVDSFAPLSRRYPARLCRLPRGFPLAVFSPAVAELFLVRRMSARLLLLTCLAIMQTSCSLSLRHDAYWISLPASHTRNDCFSVAKEVERFALLSGYHGVQESTRGDRIALFQRDTVHIQVLRQADVCSIRVSMDGYSDRSAALAERQRLYSALRARGINARLDEEPNTEMVEVIDYRGVPF